MDEQTQTPTDVGASVQLDVEPTVPASAPALSDEQRLERLLRNLVKGLIAAVAIFAVIYFFGQRQSHVEQAASLPDQAVASAEAAVRANPNDIDARLALAARYAQTSRLDDAITQLREILKAQPKNRPAMLGIGELEFKKGDLEVAKGMLSKYVETGLGLEFTNNDPQLERGYYTLGLVELALDDAKSAVTHLQSALKIDGSDADAWYALGNAQRKVGDAAAAAQAYGRALAFVPSGWCDPYDGLSSAYDDLGDEQGSTFASAMVRICKGGGLASAEALKSLVRSQYGVGALFGLGLAAENDHENASALAYYQQLLSLDRTNIAALSAISRLGATPDPQPITEK